MTSTTIGRPELIHAYIERLGFHEPDVLARLRVETAPMPNAGMQIAPEQGALLGLLVEIIGARRCLEIGTFTGYSSTAIALAMPADGTLVCCDLSEAFTAIARRYWVEAGVAGRVDCGQVGANCSTGNFDRPSLPSNFAFPLGLPGNLGLRLISWETSK